MRKKKILGWMLMLFLLGLLAGCTAKDENPKEQEISPTVEAQQDNAGTEEKGEIPGASVEVGKKEQKSEEKGKKGDAVTWVLPDHITESMLENVTLVNEELAKDGYSFCLEIEPLPADSYREKVVPLLESGEADIASLGMDFADGSRGYAQDLIRAGYFEELSEYLSSEKGKQLKEWYCDSEWGCVETDGGIYSLPNQYGMKGNCFFVFNKAYVSEQMLKNFSGSVRELETILDSIKIPKGVYPILGGFSLNSLVSLCGKQEEAGVFFDLRTGKVENPYLNKEFCQSLLDINSLHQKKYLGVFDRRAIEKEVEKQNFVVWLGTDYDEFYEKIKEKVITVPMVFSMPNALSCTNGISKNAKHKEEALQLLTLLFTEEKYANLFVLGEEGEDYQVKDGYAFSLGNAAGSSFRNSLLTGIFDALLPFEGDSMTTNRREVKNKMYQSEYCLDSAAVLGFKIDYTAFDESMKAVDQIIDEYDSVWQADDPKQKLQELADKFKNANGDKVLAELEQQMKAWKER